MALTLEKYMSRLYNHMSRFYNYSPLPSPLFLVSFLRLEQLSNEPKRSASHPEPVRWPRALRPLLWWGLLVAVLFAYRTHQRLSEQTRLLFTVSLQGHSVLEDGVVQLDGHAVTTGDRVSIGRHRLTISHQKAEPLATNLFFWYGEHNLGDFALKRGMGILALDVRPPAKLITIRGPEFEVTLTNSCGMTSSVPIDAYEIAAQSTHWMQREEALVSLGLTSVRRIAPRLGDLELACNQYDAQFELLTSEGNLMQSGSFPATIEELPEGTYTLKSQHHRNRMSQNVRVVAATKDAAKADFVYGSAVLETEPAGAAVASIDGSDWGVTPLTLAELQPGVWQFNLWREGYEHVEITLQITAQQTNAFRTNLVSVDYARDLDAGRRYLAAGDYARAKEAIRDALRAKPDDATATALQREAAGLESMSQAETLGQRGDYRAAIEELQASLKLLPGNQRARTLLADFNTRESERKEKARQARLNRPREVFAKRLALHDDSALFESHELKTSKKAAVVSAAILAALRDKAPTFTIGLHASPASDVTEIVAKRETLGQARICVVVVGQITDDETQILFEVMEYKVDVAGKVLGTLLNIQALGGQNNANPVHARHTPLHPSRVGQLTDKMKVQIEEGVRIITERIQGAIGTL